MVIIIEGPDGSGKTTLANQLAKQNKCPIIHKCQPKSAEKKRMIQEYVDTIKSNKNVIFDRCWYSEMVYGPIMRDASVIDFYDMYELERLLAKSGAIIIYATGSKTALWQRCQSRGEDYITTRDTFNAICDGFDALMRLPHLIPVVHYEYKDV